MDERILGGGGGVEEGFGGWRDGLVGFGRRAVGRRGATKERERGGKDGITKKGDEGLNQLTRMTWWVWR